MTTYQSEVLADSPLVYWKLDETTGTTAADTSGNNRPGTYPASGVTRGTSSLLADGSGYASDFTGGGVSRASETWMNVTTLTTEALIQPDSGCTAAAYHAVISRDDTVNAASRAFTMSVFSGRLVGTVWIGGVVQENYVSPAGSLACDGVTKYHVAVTFDGTTVRGYINGALSGSFAASGSVQPVTQPLTVGAANGGASWPFDGRIDEAALYGSALSATRLLAHYNAATTISTDRTGTLAGTLPALTGSLSGTFTPAPVSGSIAATLPALSATFAASNERIFDTDTTYSNDGYNYDGAADVTYDPPPVPPPPGIVLAPIRRVHQHLDPPTLVNGRPV